VAERAVVTTTAEPALVVGAAGVRDPATSFPCFDGLRAIAAILVLLHHASFYSGSMFHGHFDAYLTHADIGVAIFFLISGFLLYRPFVAAALADRPGPSVRRFFVRRALRIYPAYWAALILITVFFGLNVPQSGFRTYLEYATLTQIYDNFTRATGGISQAWTLAVEVSFYLFLPLYAALMVRLHRRRDARTRVWIEALGLVVLYAISIGFRLIIFSFHSGRIYTLGVYWLPANLDYFSLGMGLALASVWFAQRGSRPRIVDELANRPVLSWAIGIASFVVMAKGVHLPVGLVRLNGKKAFARQGLYGVSAFFVLFPAVFGPQDRSVVRRFLRWPPLVYVGLVSYGVYLWHQTWLERAVTWNHRPEFQASYPAIVTAGFALTLLTASLSWFLIERPLLRRRDRYRP
jgi:peptidoglycan/LPS O-acetylase OafA/YrhL